MFTKLTDTTKAAIFSVLLLLLGVGAALLINMLGLTTGFGMFTLWMTTPAVATLIMLLVVTRDGYSSEAWKSLGLHRLGLSVWWIAFGVSLIITVAATALVWATPLASFVVPEYGIVSAILDFFFVLVVFTPTFILAEEVGIRGYLLPKLLALGMRRALLLSGLVWAAWHLILFYLTPLFPTANALVFVPLVVGTIVAASFLFGYFRIYTGSVWPGAIAHAVHNSLVDTLSALTATSYPVLVNLYLVGDNGILIVVSTTLGAIWAGHILRRRALIRPQPGADAPGGQQSPAATAAPR
jgi:membrane protease YdiL (CAAX protease family)